MTMLLKENLSVHVDFGALWNNSSWTRSFALKAILPEGAPEEYRLREPLMCPTQILRKLHRAGLKLTVHESCLCSIPDFTLTLFFLWCFPQKGRVQFHAGDISFGRIRAIVWAPDMCKKNCYKTHKMFVIWLCGEALSQEPLARMTSNLDH